jgi:hypothetical protein
MNRHNMTAVIKLIKFKFNYFKIFGNPEFK